jgi:micrococcal nuclease
VVAEIIDGDTFKIADGRSVRLLSVNAPNVGETKFREAANLTIKLIKDKTVWLEYDRYQDDKFNRILAWVWVGCEGTPEFEKYDYMVVSETRSRAEGLTQNPKNCLKGKLVNEELVKAGLAKVEPPEDRGKLKYEDRLFQGSTLK